MAPRMGGAISVNERVLDRVLDFLRGPEGQLL